MVTAVTVGVTAVAVMMMVVMMMMRRRFSSLGHTVHRAKGRDDRKREITFHDKIS